MEDDLHLIFIIKKKKPSKLNVFLVQKHLHPKTVNFEDRQINARKFFFYR